MYPIEVAKHTPVYDKNDQSVCYYIYYRGHYRCSVHTIILTFYL